MSAVLNIPQFAIRLNAPTSTSLHIEVAMRFAGGTDGMIIQLNNESDTAAWRERHFACDWLSAFPEESERLFMGGRFQLKLETVRIVETKDNYRRFIRAFHLFDAMLSGQNMHPKNVTVTRADVRIVRGAVRGFLGESNGFHAFVNDTFRHFCARKTQIVLDLLEMWRMKNNDFVSLILNEVKRRNDFDGSEGDDVNLFQPVLFELFGNVKHVVVEANWFPFDLERLSQYAVPQSLRRMTIKGEWLKKVSVDTLNVGQWKVEVVDYGKQLELVR